MTFRPVVLALLIWHGPLLAAAPPDRAEDAVLRLDALLQQAVARNPTIRATQARWKAALQKRPQAVALPDPQLELMPYLTKMAEEEEEWGVQVSQMIPHPRRRAIAGRIADKEARAAYLKHQIAVRNAIADTKEAFVELYYIDRAQVVTREVSKLYARYAGLAAGGVDAGGPRLPETFRAEAQRSQLGYDLVLLQQMRDAETARLQAAVGSPELAVTATEELGEVPERLPEKAALERTAEAHNQELAAAGVEVERAQDQVVQARLVRTPDFSLGAQFMKTGGQDLPGGDPTRDPLRLNVGVTLPIWGDKNRAVVAEAREGEKAARSERDAQLLSLRADLARTYFALANAHRLVRLYRDSLIPQSRQAMQSAETLHRTGAASILSVIETTVTFHNFELARLRATADFFQNVAKLERLIGTALVIESGAPAKEVEE
jgi:outer membrane protein, heavy metal efflux system